MRFFLAVHSVPVGAVGGGIRAVTEARCRGPWLLGPGYAATHAFVAWTHGDGIHYRLDGQPGGAKPSLWAGPDVRDPLVPHAAWELHSGVLRAHKRSIELVGKPYDEVEALAQVSPALAKLGWWEGGTICTGICTDILQHAGVFGVDLVAKLQDLLPERFGQALELEQGPLSRLLQPARP